ncbi:hypothetical protein TNCV_3898101 [Trichonephila clavipes]|nr:hypothetical protein TNCV_3898101 [Trichonephila clavipes]
MRNSSLASALMVCSIRPTCRTSDLKCWKTIVPRADIEPGDVQTLMQCGRSDRRHSSGYEHHTHSGVDLGHWRLKSAHTFSDHHFSFIEPSARSTAAAFQQQQLSSITTSPSSFISFFLLTVFKIVYEEE